MGAIMLAALYLLLVCCAEAGVEPQPLCSLSSTSLPKPPACPVSVSSKLGTCVSILGGVLGDPLLTPCCAALLSLPHDEQNHVKIACLCAAIDAGALGIVPTAYKPPIIVNIFLTCGFKLPSTLSCP